MSLPPPTRASRRLLLAAAVALTLAACPPALGATPTATVPSVELTGTIDPATSAWLRVALDDAEEARAPFVIVRLDTPGGLDSSMREMVQAILGSPLPVVVHVTPNGARAASAGLFVTLAADVAAMAPQTNIGSATPISLGGQPDEVLGRKIRNDAAAYARALAEGHGRNADLAERMVREAVNVPASRAQAERLVELVAGDDAELLRMLDGHRVRGPKERTLQTDGVRIERRDMPLRFEIQQLLVNPTVAYLLLLLGVAGLMIEVFTPGLFGPGVVGALALLLGLYGTAQLPVTATGVLLLLLGVALIGAELAVTSGALAAGGAAALVLGGLLLFDTDSEAFAVSVPIALSVGSGLGAITVFAVYKGLAARSRPRHGGAEELVGREGTVRTPLDPIGQVFVAGERWRAEAATESGPVPAGTRVRIDAVRGLTLHVQPLPATAPTTEEEP